MRPLTIEHNINREDLFEEIFKTLEEEITGFTDAKQLRILHFRTFDTLEYLDNGDGMILSGYNGYYKYIHMSKDEPNILIINKYTKDELVKRVKESEEIKNHLKDLNRILEYYRSMKIEYIHLWKLNIKQYDLVNYKLLELLTCIFLKCNYGETKIRNHIALSNYKFSTIKHCVVREIEINGFKLEYLGAILLSKSSENSYDMLDLYIGGMVTDLCKYIISELNNDELDIVRSNLKGEFYRNKILDVRSWSNE